MRFLILGALCCLAACSAEPGSEAWCEAKAGQPKLEWTAADAATYARNCIIEGAEVGSQEWCEDLAAKPKGEWTANEAKSYAKHCVL